MLEKNDRALGPGPLPLEWSSPVGVDASETRCSAHHDPLPAKKLNPSRTGRRMRSLPSRELGILPAHDFDQSPPRRRFGHCAPSGLSGRLAKAGVEVLQLFDAGFQTCRSALFSLRSNAFICPDEILSGFNLSLRKGTVSFAVVEIEQRARGIGFRPFEVAPARFQRLCVRGNSLECFTRDLLVGAASGCPAAMSLRIAIASGVRIRPRRTIAARPASTSSSSSPTLHG